MTTRTQVQQAIDGLRAARERYTKGVPIREACRIITDAGIGDTDLGRCLLYELDAHAGGETMVWDALAREQAQQR